MTRKGRHARAALAVGALLMGGGCAGAGAAARGTGPEAPTPPGLGALPEPSAAEEERRGDRHVAEGDLAQGFLAYDRAIGLEADRVSARYKKARLLLAKRLLPEARAELAAVLALDPGHALARLGLGQASFVAGEDERAAAELGEALEASAGLWQAHHLLALIHDRAGRRAAAAASYRRAIELSPDTAPLHNNLGVSLLASGDPAGAEAALRTALRLAPGEDRVLNNLALALARQGKRDEALLLFTKSVREAGAWNNIGFLLLQDGRTEEAIAALERAVAADPSYYERAHGNLRRALEAPGAGGAEEGPPRGR